MNFKNVEDSHRFSLIVIPVQSRSVSHGTLMFWGEPSWTCGLLSSTPAPLSRHQWSSVYTPAWERTHLQTLQPALRTPWLNLEPGGAKIPSGEHSHWVREQQHWVEIYVCGVIVTSGWKQFSLNQRQKKNHSVEILFWNQQNPNGYSNTWIFVLQEVLKCKYRKAM